MNKVLFVLYLLFSIYSVSFALDIEPTRLRLNIAICIGNQKTPIHTKHLEDRQDRTIDRTSKKDTIRISEPLREIQLRLFNDFEDENGVIGVTIYHEKAKENKSTYYSIPFFEKEHIVLHKTYNDSYSKNYDDTVLVSPFTKQEGIYRIVIYDKSYGVPEIKYELICFFTPQIDFTKQKPPDMLKHLIGKWKIKEIGWEGNGGGSRFYQYSENAKSDSMLKKTWIIECRKDSDSIIIEGMYDNYRRKYDSIIRFTNLDSVFFIGYNRNMKKLNSMARYDFAKYHSNEMYFVNDQSIPFNKRNEARNKIERDSFIHISYMKVEPRKQFQYFSENPTELILELGRQTYNHRIDYDSYIYFDFRRVYVLKKIE